MQRGSSQSCWEGSHNDFNGHTYVYSMLIVEIRLTCSTKNIEILFSPSNQISTSFFKQQQNL